MHALLCFVLVIACGCRIGYDASTDGALVDDAQIDATPAGDVDAAIGASGFDDPVAYWRFDETNGTIASDSSLNDNVAVFIGQPTWVPNGKIAGAIQFDGLDDWLEIAADPSLNLGTTYSLTAWVMRLNAAPTETIDYIVRIRGDIDTMLRVDSGRYNGVAYHAGGSDWPEFDLYGPTDGAAEGVWQHVAFTVSGLDIVLYRDGVPHASGTIPSAASDSPPSTSRIGILRSGNSGSFDGLLDEVRVYNRTLSAPEVAALHVWTGG